VVPHSSGRQKTAEDTEKAWRAAEIRGDSAALCALSVSSVSEAKIRGLCAFSVASVSENGFRPQNPSESETLMFAGMGNFCKTESVSG